MSRGVNENANINWAFMVRTQTTRHNIRNLEEGGYVTENHGVGGSIPPLGTTTQTGQMLHQNGTRRRRCFYLLDQTSLKATQP